MEKNREEKKKCMRCSDSRKRRPRLVREQRRTRRTSDIKNKRLEFLYAKW
jgi:hypothetical protein